MNSLLGNLRESVDHATFEAKKQARLLTEQNKLKKLKAQEQEQLVALGRESWELFRAGQPVDSKLQEHCEQIQITVQQIAQQERQIQAIRQEQPPEPVVCAQCGREVQADDAFCAGCGTPALPAESATRPAAPQEVCPRCGHLLRSEAKFCSGCGERVSEAEQ